MDQLVNFIIRPPRADYSPNDDLLEQEFMLKGRWFQRKDLEVKNDLGKKLQCSHYMPVVIPEGKALPCVIYCHGNSGCRADASEAAIILLPTNITVFTLDFSGSGLSEGEHVTLGWNEKEDLKAVVNYLRTDGNVSCIALWGRSMGAVTSLMYGAEDPSIAGMVLDSPFSNLVDLMMELVDTYKYPLPKFTVKLAIQHMRKIVKRKANFDIMDLDTIQLPIYYAATDNWKLIGCSVLRNGMVMDHPILCPKPYPLVLFEEWNGLIHNHPLPHKHEEQCHPTKIGMISRWTISNNPLFLALF